MVNSITEDFKFCMVVIYNVLSGFALFSLVIFKMVLFQESNSRS